VRIPRLGDRKVDEPELHILSLYLSLISTSPALNAFGLFLNIPEWHKQ
jgi:hypothetical protein